MALFGAPTAHEDDPERAVRASLAIRDFALEEDSSRGSGSRPARRRTTDAAIELERALAFYRSVDASFYIAQIESALAEAHRDSA